jgi:hypothetical protein
MLRAVPVTDEKHVNTAAAYYATFSLFCVFTKNLTKV